MQINIKSTGIEMTDAIKQYATEKVGSLTKFFNKIQQADIDVGMKSHHHLKGKIYYAEVNLHVPGKILRVSKNAEDLYKAIDKVKDHLKVEVKKFKEKLRQQDKKLLRQQKEYRV